MAIQFSVTGELLKKLSNEVTHDVSENTVWAHKIDVNTLDSGNAAVGYHYTGGDAAFINGSQMQFNVPWESTAVTATTKEAKIVGVEYCNAHLSWMQVRQASQKNLELDVSRQLKGKLAWALDAAYGRTAAKVALADGGNKVEVARASATGADILKAIYKLETQMADASFGAEGSIIGMSAVYFDLLRQERGLTDTRFISADGTTPNQNRVMVGGMTIQRLPYWSKFAINNSTDTNLPEERRGDFTGVIAVAINPDAIIAADHGAAVVEHTHMQVGKSERFDVVYALGAAVQVPAGVGAIVLK